MSSVERSNATKNGQLKAPDKWETTAKTIIISIPNTASSDNTMSDTMSSSTIKNQSQSQSHSKDAQKSTNSVQQDSQNFKNWDDVALKSLLDEAISFKGGPKDIEKKSTTFKELLHETLVEDQADLLQSTTRSSRNNRRHQHQQGGSLQDLVVSKSDSEQLDGDSSVIGQKRRHHKNSRHPKYASSVSSRQREGGSLPCNVNASSNYNPSAYIDKLLFTNYSEAFKKDKEISNKKDGSNKDGTINNNSSSSYHYNQHHHHSQRIGDNINYNNNRDELNTLNIQTVTAVNANDKNYTIINIEEPDENRHLLAHDSLAQGLSEQSGDEGTELVAVKKAHATMNFMQNANIDMGEPSRQNTHSVDKSVSIFNRAAISHINETHVNKATIKTPAEAKLPSLGKQQGLLLSQFPKQFDENGNAILNTKSLALTANQTSKTKSKRRDKADRNTTTWTVPQKDSDTKYNIDSIVAFIENKDTNKKDIRNNNLKTTENRKEKTNKNTANTHKKDVNRLKKSTSMEELKSSSKIEEEREIAQSEREKISLRRQQQQQQQQQQNAQKRNAVAAIDSGKDTKQQPQQQQQQQQQQPPQQQSNPQPTSNKRGERRSWGTEELNYLGERDAAAAAAATDDRDTKQKQKEKSKNNKKSEQNVSTTASIESIPMSIEAAEFHVVTKKKKTKKRQIFEEAKAKQQQSRDSMHQTQSGRNFNSSSSSASAVKYHPSSGYTNDRDIYMNSLTTKETSMSPSDKSDSSDLDSIHSLPIESTKNCTPIISYAEIARKANPIEKANTSCSSNAWPPVSSSCASTNPSLSSSMKNAETPDASNVSTCSSTLSAKSQGMIKLSPLNDEKAVSIADETKHFDTPKAAAAQGETLKNQLQKSKSCDNEKCVTTMNLDQFPGLEKTVKPQKFAQPNFASVLTSSPAAATEKSKPQSIKNRSVCETNGAKENPSKVLIKPIEDKAELKNNNNNTSIDSNHSKLVFVQNNATAEEIANSSDASTLFVSLNVSSTLKKSNKKSQSNCDASINPSVHTSTIHNSLSINNRINANQQRTTAAVIFSDRETSHENVSPLLFGDFNDDILQLMKQDESQMAAADSSKHNDIAPTMSSKFDPGYASNTSSTESHAVTDSYSEQNNTDNGPIAATQPVAELSHKKINNSVSKKTANLSSKASNVTNNKTSDVVSNQSMNYNYKNNNNNNNHHNNNNINDINSSNSVIISSSSDADNLNNNQSIREINIDHAVAEHLKKNRIIQNDDGETALKRTSSAGQCATTTTTTTITTNAINNNIDVDFQKRSFQNASNRQGDDGMLWRESNNLKSNNNNNNHSASMYPQQKQNATTTNCDVNVNSKNVDKINQLNTSNSNSNNNNRHDNIDTNNSDNGTKAMPLNRESNKYAPKSTSIENVSVQHMKLDSTSASAAGKIPPYCVVDGHLAGNLQHNHEDIVHFVGLAWEKTVSKEFGPVCYFDEK